MRLTGADDAAARERPHATTRDRHTKRPALGYLSDEPGQPLDLEPRYCRCERPAPVAEVDRRHASRASRASAAGRLRAELNQLDLRALAAVRRGER